MTQLDNNNNNVVLGLIEDERCPLAAGSPPPPPIPPPITPIYHNIFQAWTGKQRDLIAEPVHGLDSSAYQLFLTDSHPFNLDTDRWEELCITLYVGTFQENRNNRLQRWLHSIPREVSIPLSKFIDANQVTIGVGFVSI
ncbi:hypothetical protein PPL_03814 [Heterostelium album PN500]|uniref:Uncharacterized protein n=1 Tax=Heterostelium pallidum (strain ATCC 26659 / Pp 5 / PN500) TaxID=670386 RepID=D3B6Q9_HETP5|nr:hypothetical protein PPL_03814 [Heterostelium album PN500]EFA83029.1 hypothetical protein PPL_03814 [Heterostelium album PN500]|eukprot:XP_020435146.1 hypothetical protein PPL_03814 [Heterostelium album PN500]